MSVILEALQKARTDDPREGNASRVVDVRPANGVTMRRPSALRAIWLVTSLVILLVVASAGTGAFYWVISHREQFSFGIRPRASEPASSLSQSPAQPTPAVVATPLVADLPPPVPMQSVVPTPAAPSQAALPPPPVGATTAVAASPNPAVSVATATPANPFSLGTILCGDANDCSAVVNGRTLHRGEMYKEFRVMEITSTEVRLQRGTEAPVVLSLLR